MRFEFLGTGTSFGVPEVGCACDVCVSADARDRRLRCSLWLQHADLSIVIDTPPDFRQQCLRTGIDRLDAVFFTHGHADHLFGVDDIRKFNTLQKSEIPVYVPTFMEDQFRRMFGYAPDLRSATQGRASYSMQFHTYDAAD